ncbi:MULTISPECIES: ABC transporter permease [Streptomyces]|jgi:ABC-2 type transport system permease protein|uniref:Transport permease protein n=1 Tax=Streptomyces microflavus DSM 40593 TaxID=1303692 RepID=N0CV15_STRMI|nr:MULTISPECIES: ABC transporter permease [Streptomyces]AGK78754.1 ABC transporter membrane protein [Streptomyces microflavus DSM 40593]MCX4653854.1 ABC transporter permease [Streptomyces microflavus]WSS35242.1 ABC transporter permease [Streptomyces microflavus]WST16191.1 ABC transporter permease [Streptomyces microflavus]SCK29817.1 ABC-2 type transport system permease protein [Streptomyces sp. ScaeMP-e48]
MTTPTVLADDRTAPGRSPSSPSKASASARRLTALARAELILLVRNRSAIFVALVLPIVMIFSIRASLQQIDLAGTGLSIAGAALTGGIGIVLVQVVYMTLVTGYVTRREELVLKRLRTGEVTDREILAANALPAVALALVQVVLLVAAGAVAFDLSAPKRPELFLAGLLVGLVMMSGLAAATSAVTRTVQTSQLTTLPLFFVSLFASGIFVPLDIFPDGLASVFELLPLTGVMTLIRHGWLGGVEGGDLLTAAVAALAWTAFAVFAVQRWFRWDPRG